MKMAHTFELGTKEFGDSATHADCQQNQPQTKQSGHGARAEWLEGSHWVGVLGEQVVMASK
jgi:hypothetical protein